MTKFFSVFAASALSLGGWFGAGPISAQGSDWPAVFQEVTEVNVVNVDVVVTDKDGNPVRGLKPEDFEVTSNGEVVDVSNFFAVDGGEVQSLSLVEGGDAPAEEGAIPESKAVGAQEEAPLQMILYIDDANIQASNRKRVFNRLQEFLLEDLPEDAKVMLVTNSTNLEVRLPFTSARHDVFAAIAEAEKDGPSGPRFDIDKRRILEEIAGVNVEAGNPSLGARGDLDRTPEEMSDLVQNQARGVLPQITTYSQRRFLHVQKTIAVLRQFVDTAAGLPGRKSVVYISDGLPLRPGEALYEAYSRRFESLGGVSERVSPQIEASRDDSTKAFQDLVAHANASAVTFYTLFAAPPASTERGSAATTAGAGGNFGTFDFSVGNTEERNAQESMVLLAEGTGGQYGLTPSSLKGVLSGLVEDWGNRYSLGFQANRLAPGKVRRIDIKVANKAYKVRFRDSFLERSQDELVAARTLSALSLSEVDNPLEILLEVREQTEAEDGHYLVPLRIQVPLGKLVLLPGEKFHQAQVSMFVAARDSKGRTSPVVKHNCPIRIPNKEILVALGRPAACGVQLKMRGGQQTVAVSVRDELAAIDSTASLDLDVPSGIASADVAEGAR